MDNQNFLFRKSGGASGFTQGFQHAAETSRREIRGITGAVRGI